MMVKNKTNRNYKKSQTGRSMVEMLGVLAIVGVLSVGGVYGYGVAMKKHKANELLHQASMLATTISAQAMTNDGKLPETTTSFGNSSYGNFSTSVTNALDGKGFSITIENVDSGACTQLEKMAGGMVREATCDGTTATITYYKNLATNDEEGKNSPTGPDPACADVTCPEGSTCSRGQCQCSNGLFVCGTQCCAEGTYCTGPDTGVSSYTCAKPTSGCTKNSDCKDAEGNVDTTKYCWFSDDSCTNLGTGTCTDKGTLTPYTLNLPGGDLTVYKGGQKNWWSASNLCQAHRKQLVTMSDLGVSDNGQTYCYFDSAKRVNAGKDETYQCNCIGDSGCTTTKTELYKLGTSGYLWLADNSKSNSCLARLVLLYNGYVRDGYRDDYNYALCR